MEKTLKDKLNDLSEALRDKINPMIAEKRDDLLEEDLQHDNEGKYFLYYDSDEVDVGVGLVKIRKEVIQNEDMAEKDAQEEIAVEIANLGEAFYTLLEDNKISSLLADIVRSL